MIINSFKLLAQTLQLELYYSDTDSLVLNAPLPDQHLDSAKLGLLKLEHTINEGYFVSPKIYWLECKAKDGLIYYVSKNQLSFSLIIESSPHFSIKVVKKDWEQLKEK
jgi:hypothetical protein